MRNIRQLLVAFLMSAVVACGGGGTIGGGGTPTSPVYTLALSLSNGNQSATTVSKAVPLTVTVKLSSSNGGSVGKKLVTFKLNDTSLASFNNGAGTAQTNDNGEATIGLLVGTKSGAGIITAELASGEKADITFSSAGDGGVVGAESNVTLRFLKADGTVNNDLSFANPLTVEATLTSTKVAVSGKIISFKLSDNALAKFSNATASAITDANGVARIVLSVGTKNGVGTVTPTFDGESFVPQAFNSAGDDPTGQAAVITLTLKNKNGVDSASISKAEPLDAIVELKSATGVPVADKQINFSINLPGLASFTNQTATARTNENGIATIGLVAGATNGTGTLTAILDSNVVITASRPFTSAGDGAVIGNGSNVTLRLLKADGSVSNDLSLANPLTVEATLTSTSVAVAGQIVSFQLSDPALAKFSNATASAITDANGVARIVLNVGTKNGVGTITPVFAGQTYAPLPFNSAGDDPSGQVTVMSLSLKDKAGADAFVISKDVPLDAIVVLKSLTGVPVADRQINFAINIEGLAYFNNQTATARTDANGVAKIGLTAGTTNGTGTITATFDADKSIQASRSFDSLGDGGSVTTDPVSSVLLQSDKLQLGSGLTDKIELTAIIKDVNQILLKDSKVTFAIETGSDAELEVVSSTTNNMGVATAILTSKTNFALRDIVVSATAGSSSKKSILTIKVVGTDIQVTAPSAVVVGNSVNLSFDLVDSAFKPIRNTAIQLTSQLNNQFSNTNPITDSATGRAVVQYTAAIPGDDTITVSALGVTKSFKIVVNSDAFAFVKPATEPPILEIPLGEIKSSKVQWTRDSLPVMNEEITFTTTRGQIGSTNATVNSVVAKNNTDNSGEASVYMQSDYAGFANISASTKPDTIVLQTQKLVEFIATEPDPNPDRKLEVQVFPAQLGVGEKAIVQAIVRDVKNNPVKNKRVAFKLDESFGGQLSPATAITNSQGVASTEFLADTSTPGGGVPSNPQGLQITASLVDKPEINGKTSVVVGNRTLFFRFATGNSIRESENKVLYLKDYAVLVTDSAGNPVPNQSLNVSVAPTRYAKGRWFKSPVNQAFKSWIPKESNDAQDPTCKSEDVNRNGILDRNPLDPLVPVEDVNGDGQLTPGNVAAVDRTITAGADGIAYFTLTYAKEMAAWVTVEVNVSGIAAGTENVFSRQFVLDYFSDDITKEESRPWDSPFGVNAQTDTNDNSATRYTTMSKCYDNINTYPLPTP